MGVREDRAARLVKLWDQGDRDALRFCRDDRGNVHVLALAGDRPERQKRLFGNSDSDRMLRAMLGEEWSLCAVKLVRHRGGFENGAQLVSHFPDEHLCRHCHTALGDRAVIIFEANQHDGRDPTELGRMNDDFVTKGQMLR